MTEELKQETEKPILFGIVASKKDYQKDLLMLDMTFKKLFDDIVIPYQNNKPFFIDGVPVKAENLTKIKILQQTELCKGTVDHFHYHMEHGIDKIQKMYAEQYNIRIEAILRANAEDVTSQIIKAYDAEVKPRIKDYLPNRQEILGAAFTAFINAMKTLST